TLLYEYVPFMSDDDVERASEKRQERKDEAMAMAQAEAAQAQSGADPTADPQAQRHRAKGTAADAGEDKKSSWPAIWPPPGRRRGRWGTRRMTSAARWRRSIDRLWALSHRPIPSPSSYLPLFPSSSEVTLPPFRWPDLPIDRPGEPLESKARSR